MISNTDILTLPFRIIKSVLLWSLNTYSIVMQSAANIKKTVKKNHLKRLPLIQAIKWLQLLLLIFGLYPFRVVVQPEADTPPKQLFRRRRLRLTPPPTSTPIPNDQYKIVFSAVGLSITLLHLLLITGINVLIIQSGFSDRHSAQFSVMPSFKIAVIQQRIVNTLIIFSTFHSLIQTLMGRTLVMRRIKLLVRLNRAFSSAGIDTVPLYRRLYWQSLISTVGLLVFLATQIYHQTFFYLNGKQQFNAISMFIICWLYGMPVIYKQIQAYVCAVYVNQIRSHFEMMNRKLLEHVLLEETKRQSKQNWFQEE